MLIVDKNKELKDDDNFIIISLEMRTDYMMLFQKAGYKNDRVFSVKALNLCDFKLPANPTENQIKKFREIVDFKVPDEVPAYNGGIQTNKNHMTAIFAPFPKKYMEELYEAARMDTSL